MCHPSCHLYFLGMAANFCISLTNLFRTIRTRGLMKASPCLNMPIKTANQFLMWCNFQLIFFKSSCHKWENNCDMPSMKAHFYQDLTLQSAHRWLGGSAGSLVFIHPTHSKMATQWSCKRELFPHLQVQLEQKQCFWYLYCKRERKSSFYFPHPAPLLASIRCNVFNLCIAKGKVKREHTLQYKHG